MKKQNIILVLLLSLVSLSTMGQTRAKTKVVPITQKYLAKARAGDADAQLQVGFWYATGIKLAKDKAKAKFWYTKSAKQGNAAALRNLAEMDGKYMFSDMFSEPHFLMEQAALAGDLIAQRNMEVRYKIQAEFNEDNPEWQSYLYKQAIEWGHRLATNRDNHKQAEELSYEKISERREEYMRKISENEDADNRSNKEKDEVCNSDSLFCKKIVFDAIHLINFNDYHIRYDIFEDRMTNFLGKEHIYFPEYFPVLHKLGYFDNVSITSIEKKRTIMGVNTYTVYVMADRTSSQNKNEKYKIVIGISRNGMVNALNLSKIFLPE